MDTSTRRIYDFYDELGYLTKTGVLRLERVWNTHSGSIRLGWAMWEPALRRLREEWNDPRRYENFEYLRDRILEFDRASGRSGTPPNKRRNPPLCRGDGRTAPSRSWTIVSPSAAR